MSLNPSPLRILVADKMTLVREALCLTIDSWPNMEVVAQAGNSEEAWHLARKLIPDVLVLEIPLCNDVCNSAGDESASQDDSKGCNSKGCNSTPLQITERLKSSHPTVRVLGLANHRDELSLRHLVAAGVAGYLLKASGVEELEKAIGVLAVRGGYLDPSIEGQVVDGCIRLENRRDEEQLTSLSPVQIEILKMVAWGHSNADIADHLQFSIKTIEAHKAAMGKKSGLRTRAEMVRLAIQRGWLSLEN